MKTSVTRRIKILSIIFIGLSSGMALGWENCLSKSKQATQATVTPAPLEVFQAGEQTPIEKILPGKKMLSGSPEQIAAAHIQCLSAMHRDLDDGLTDASCPDAGAAVSAARPMRKTAH
jgi:hypothetical protein